MHNGFAFTVLIWTLLAAGPVSAQMHSGKVLSRENSIEVAGVLVIDTQGQVKDTTDERGFFVIHEAGSYQFQKEGYLTRRQELDPQKFTVVDLEEEQQNLSEVLIKTDNFQAELRKISS